MLVTSALVLIELAAERGTPRTALAHFGSSGNEASRKEKEREKWIPV